MLYCDIQNAASKYSLNKPLQGDSIKKGKKEKRKKKKMLFLTKIMVTN
jgi:hypothetical protein